MTKITHTRPQDDSNKYIYIEDGNVEITLQIHEPDRLSCYIDIELDDREYYEFKKHNIHSIKDARKFIKKIHDKFGNLYNLSRKE